MEEEKDRDMRQLIRMIQVINAYLSNEVDVQNLVATLSFLLDNLDEVTDEWREMFRDKWVLLEILNAEACEAQRKATQAESKYALEVVTDLRELIQQAIES